MGFWFIQTIFGLCVLCSYVFPLFFYNFEICAFIDAIIRSANNANSQATARNTTLVVRELGASFEPKVMSKTNKNKKNSLTFLPSAPRPLLDQTSAGGKWRADHIGCQF